MAGQRDVEVRRRTLFAQLPFARVSGAMSPTRSKYKTATLRTRAWEPTSAFTGNNPCSDVRTYFLLAGGPASSCVGVQRGLELLGAMCLPRPEMGVVFRPAVQTPAAENDGTSSGAQVRLNGVCRWALWQDTETAKRGEPQSEVDSCMKAHFTIATTHGFVARTTVANPLAAATLHAICVKCAFGGSMDGIGLGLKQALESGDCVLFVGAGRPCRIRSRCSGCRSPSVSSSDCQDRGNGSS
jgi:hypothetical protein